MKTLSKILIFFLVIFITGILITVKSINNSLSTPEEIHTVTDTINSQSAKKTV